MSRFTNSLRRFRKYHKYLGLTLATLLFISAATGLLLGWKKHSDVIQPPTQKGEAQALSEWRPLAELALIAKDTFHILYPDQAQNQIDRLDVRPTKGIVKVLFADGWWEVQVDGASGAVLSVARRHSDWIEALHDGSIVGDLFKLLSMNVLGIGLLFILLSGWWLWYGPRRIRQERRNRE